MTASWSGWMSGETYRSLLAAPLLVGCDTTAMDPFTIHLLSNDEVIAVDQDQLGKAPQG